MEGDSWIDLSAVITVLGVIDTITVFYFFLEYAVRFLCSPLKRRFFFQVSTSILALKVFFYQVYILYDEG